MERRYKYESDIRVEEYVLTYEIDKTGDRKMSFCGSVFASEFSFIVLDSSADVLVKKDKKNTVFIKNGVFKLINEYFPIPTESFENYLCNDSLTIEISASFIFNSNPIESVSQFPVVPEGNPNEWMKSMLREELFTDIMIKTSTKTFKVHRAVLASHSDVFKTMFETNMKEKHQGMVTISDIEPKVMNELVSFMYTGSAPNIKTFAKELLLAADKYNIPHLQVICENELKMNLTSVNVAEILLLADKLPVKIYETDSLKEVCIKFIKHNPSVYQLDSWKKLKETSLELAVEIMEIVCNM